MMANLSKNAFGTRGNIAAALEAGAIDEYDILYLGDTQEIGWIDKNGDPVISTTRTQDEITVNGVTGLGIENGGVIPSGKSLDEIVRMLVQKAVPATYTKPTLAIANNGGQASGNVEAGTSVTPKLKATFTQNDAGALTAISILKNGVAVEEGTVSPLVHTGDAIVIGDETITFKATADYGAAAVKNDNLGNESKDNWFDAGTVNSSEYSITGKRNVFYGAGVGELPAVTSDFVRGLNDKKLAPVAGTSITIDVEVGQQYVAFAYPATLRDVNKVTYVEANDPNMAGNFTKHTINVADARGGENGLMSYKVYTYEMAVPAAATMTFTVVI